MQRALLFGLEQACSEQGFLQTATAMGWQRCCPIHKCRVTIEMQDSRRRWLTVQRCQKGDKAWCVIAVRCKGTPRAGLFAGIAIGGNQQLGKLREVGLSANLYHRVSHRRKGKGLQ